MVQWGARGEEGVFRLVPSSAAAHLLMWARELTMQCSGILIAPTEATQFMSRILAAMISSTRSSPPLTFSASLRTWLGVGSGLGLGSGLGWGWG